MSFNVLEEIQPYMDRFEKVKVLDGKLMSCSPFRQEKHPSFVLWLDGGNWKDSGGINTKGSFATLLSHLSGEDEDTVRRYLKEKTGEITDVDAVDLKLDLKIQEDNVSWADLPPEYKFRSSYLESRGISEAIQKGFKIGFCQTKNAVVLPWMDKDGLIVRFQFRSIHDKKFWFSKEGQRIKNHLFGLYHVHRKGVSKVWLVESPIDCLYLWTLGIPTLATGSASISRNQVELILKSPVESVVIATDNDEAGQRFKDHLVDLFGGRLTLTDFTFPKGAKDVNDMSPEEIFQVKEKSLTMFKLLG